jgi:hypothetical protein
MNGKQEEEDEAKDRNNAQKEDFAKGLARETGYPTTVTHDQDGDVKVKIEPGDHKRN